MNGNVQNIIFDVGMVLIDFCWEKHCRNLGFAEELIRELEINMIQSEYWSLLDEGKIEEKDAIHEFMKCMPNHQKEIEAFWKYPECFVEEYEYAAPMISRLKQTGYSVYLLSNYPLEMYKIHWPSFTFYSLVDGYIVSAVERLKKPDLAIYKLLCDRYRLKPEECLFIDDKQINVDAAIQAGMQSVLFKSYDHLKEYLEI